MARIKIIIEDDFGNVLTQEQFAYDIDLSDGRFSTLEQSVEEFKKRSSKEVSKVLLSYQQDQFIEKKT
jgi:hypothetical protein